MDDNKFWLRFWVIFLSGVVLITTLICGSCTIHRQQMIDAGYHLEQRVTTTYYDDVWVK
jgi:hypothetical protein